MQKALKVYTCCACLLKSDCFQLGLPLKIFWKDGHLFTLDLHFPCCLHRFLYERHEQSKQDLKGLEETVVSAQGRRDGQEK